MVSRIVLHIGMMKTGSTSQQQFLQDEHEALSELGFHYYQPLHIFNPYLGPNNAGFLLDATLQRIGTLREDSIAGIAQIEEELAALAEYCAGRDGTLILSEELLSGYGRGPFWRAARDLLSECCTGAEIDVIVYLRRQDLWLLSNWKQRVKGMVKEWRTFESYVARTTSEYAQRLDYSILLHDLEEAFGKEHLIVRVFEPSQLKNGDAVADFCEAVGIPQDGSLVTSHKRKNASLSLSQTEVLRAYNQISGALGTRLMILMVALSKIHRPEHEEYPLGEERRKELIERYADSNRRVAERYLGRSELFSKPEE